MALEVIKGVFTAPTVNGTDIVISGLTDPKAILLWTTKDTAAGASDTHAEFSFGMFTYNGGTVQQVQCSFRDDDALGTSATCKGFSQNSCLRGFSAATPTVEFDITGVSMDATSITLDATDAPASAILVHYMVFGGSDVSAAFCGQFTGSVAAATQDVALPTGFGNGNLLISFAHSTTTGGNNTGARFTFGVDNGTQRIAGGIWAANAQNTMATSSFLKNGDGFASLASITSFDGEATWDKANDPTDGFRVAWGNQLAAAHLFNYLILKGTFQSSIGTVAAPTAGATPVNVDYNAGFAPVGALFFSDGLASHSTIDSTATDLYFWGMGGTDGTNEGFSAITQDDANTTSFAGRVHSETKSFARYHSPGVAGAPTLDSEADGSFTGNNVRLAFNDIDSTAAVIAVLALGSASGQSFSLPVATETDAAQTPTFAKALSLPVATETDATQALAIGKAFSLPVSTETDAAQGMTFAKAFALAVATESDVAQALTFAKVFGLPVATETDVAQALIFTAAIFFDLPVATETDDAQSLSLSKAFSLPQALETDSAQGLTFQKLLSLPVASQTEVAQALAFVKSLTLPLATQTSTATTLTFGKAFDLPIAFESDEALQLTGDSHFSGIATAIFRKVIHQPMRSGMYRHFSRRGHESI